MSRKNIILGILVLAVALAGYFFLLKPQLDDRTVAVVVQETIERRDLELSFSYPSGQNGLSLIEPPITPGEALAAAYILIPTPEYIDYQQAEFSGATPAAISVFVFSADRADETEDIGRIARMQNWAAANDGLTSFSRALNTPDITEIDGLEALTYTTEAAYDQDVYIVSYRGNIYMFVGQYEGASDDLRQTFADLISNVRF